VGKHLSPRFVETCEDFGRYVLKSLSLKTKYANIVRVGNGNVQHACVLVNVF